MSVVIPASIYRNKQKYLTCHKTRERATLRIKYLDVVAAVIGCLLGQATLLEGLMPFGVAYLAIFVNWHPQRLAVITLGVGIGSILARGWTGLGVVAAAVLAIYVIRIGEETFRSDALKGLTIAGAVFCYHLMNHMLNRGDFYQLLMGILEPLLIFCISWLFAEGLTGVFVGTKQRLERMDVLAVLFFTAGIVIGLPLIEVTGIELTPVVTSWIILVLAYAGGIAPAAIFGMFLGLLLALTGYYDTLVIGLYGFAGLTAGFFREWGKTATVLGLLLTLLVFAGLGIVQVPLMYILLEGLVAGALFFILPNSVIANLRQYFPAASQVMLQENNYQVELQRQFVERLSEISQVFSELGTTFKEVTAADEVEEDDLSYFLYIVSNRVCKGCEYMSYCWDKQFYQTYTQIFKLMTVLENQGQAKAEDFVRLLKGHCRNLNRLKQSVDGSLEIYEMHRHWSQKVRKQQAIVAEQLSEVSRIIDGFSKELNLTTTRKEDMEMALKARLEENGLKIVHSRLSGQAGEEHLNVMVTKERCIGEGECRRIFQVINQMIEQPMTNYERVCGLETGERHCHLKYAPARRFGVSVGYCNSAKNGLDVSGDTFVAEQLKSGKFMSILSDGMGNGEEAARESVTATRLIQQIIRAGFNHDLAVRTVNSALLSTTEESYATIDLSFVDLFTGELEMIKIGAVDSFIKRGADVISLRGGSLPVGILQTVDPMNHKQRLQPGDFVVMMTDGILDAVNTLNKEEWLARMLRQCTFDSPQDLAQYVFMQAKGSAPAQDDMTVVVLKLEEEKVH